MVGLMIARHWPAAALAAGLVLLFVRTVVTPLAGGAA